MSHFGGSFDRLAINFWTSLVEYLDVGLCFREQRQRSVTDSGLDDILIRANEHSLAEFTRNVAQFVLLAVENPQVLLLVSELM